MSNQIELHKAAQSKWEDEVIFQSKKRRVCEDYKRDQDF